MILDITQIKEILLKNPNKGLIDAAKLNNKKLRMHLYGEGLKHEIHPIDGHEKETLTNLRKKYAKSNKDLFARLGRPIDKVFTARGGSVYYNMGDSANKQAADLSMNIKDGLSVRKWIETKWKPHTLDDPNGLIFMEIGSPINGRLMTYPTYKSITTVYDYQSAGSSLEYIVFNVSASEKTKAGYRQEDRIFRVVDDSFDYWVKLDGEGDNTSALILKDQTYPNYFGEVPAILNSDYASAETEGLMLSIYNDVIDLADDFLLTGSIRNLAKLRMAYPKYWEYASDCKVCKGEREVEGKKCESCKGTGKQIMANPGDVKLIQHPTDKNDPVITPNVAGFVEFPVDYFNFSTLEIADLENIMSLTIWGTEAKKQTPGMNLSKQGDTVKTATEVIDDIQPKADRLQSISEQAEKRHKFIIDHAIQITIDSSYKGASVNYGRRYMIESADAIWEKYSNARIKGASTSILDDLLMEYIETKYQGDPVGLNIQLKLLMVEPFIHKTVEQVKALDPLFEDYCKKLYFSEWLATMSEGALISYKVEQLKEQLTQFVTEKGLEEPKLEPSLN